MRSVAASPFAVVPLHAISEHLIESRCCWKKNPSCTPSSAAARSTVSAATLSAPGGTPVQLSHFWVKPGRRLRPGRRYDLPFAAASYPPMWPQARPEAVSGQAVPAWAEFNRQWIALSDCRASTVLKSACLRAEPHKAPQGYSGVVGVDQPTAGSDTGTRVTRIRDGSPRPIVPS
jgi:hypothetical protein